MVAYRVKSVISNPATDTLSFYGTGPGLFRSEASAASLTIDSDAYLVSSDSGDGLTLETGPWTVAVNGAVAAFETDQLGTFGAAIHITNTNVAPFPLSSITVAAGADVYGGRWGILADALASVTNASTITAETNAAIAEMADGNVVIKNTGRIHALGTNVSLDANGSHALFFAGAGTHTIQNFGTIDGGDAPGAYAILAKGAAGVESVSNSGRIAGDVDLGAGDDVFAMYRAVVRKHVILRGWVEGKVQLGDGDDRYYGGKYSETVVDGGGSDTVIFRKGGVDTYLAVTDPLSGIDGTDHISGSGYSTYNATGSTSDVKVNIDAIAHNQIAANSATGTSVGADVISGFTTVHTGSGNDEVWGAKYGETMHAGGGGDIVAGGLGNDVIWGEAGLDSLFGGDGNDTILGGLDLDVVDGGNGNDTLDGGDGDDLIYGGAGNDKLVGGAGVDSLAGDAGNDVLDGGADGDQLRGGAGKDFLAGGSGGDTFIFASVSESLAGVSTRDVVSDFQIGDRFDISAIDGSSTTAAVNDQFSWIGMNAFTKVAGQLRFGFSDGNTIVSGDVNGDGVADLQIQLTGHHQLLDLDFVL